MISILRAGPAPALPDFLACLVQHFLVGGVLPLDEILDDLEEPLALLLLGLLGFEEIRVRRGVVHHLRKDHGPAAARGRRAHQRCSVLGCPCRIDFSRALALLIASSGKATSIRFLLGNGHESFFGPLYKFGEV